MARSTFTIKNTAGFTIVELLIVIVVIAILAAISTVAYAGIQERAMNSNILSASSQAVKALRAYRAAYDRYPTVPAGQNSVCIGRGFKDWNNDGRGDCWDSDVRVIRGEYDSFNAELEMIANTGRYERPHITYNDVNHPNAPAHFTGPVFSTPAETANSGVSAGKYSVQYWIKATSCPSGDVLTWGPNLGIVRCTHILPDL